MSLYETQRLTNEYLLFHYGQDHEILPWENGPTAALHFPVRTVTELLPSPSPLPTAGSTPPAVTATAGTHTRALDIGCAVGRSAFELSKHFQEVQALDYSHAFIRTARAIQLNGQLDYQITSEGHTTAPLTAHLPDGIQPERVTFQQGNAMELPESLGTFDLVHAANLICRLPEPTLFLQRLPSLINPGGHLLLTTPCSWLEEYTPSDRWPDSSTLEWLKSILLPHFTLQQEKNLPFLIREHARKFQWTVALGTVWQRR